ncbi:MAG: hypothetical protein FWD56_00300 [Bacteroidales bacterium]|nr:hypothetical protein [Bacteroidales bacterium]
MKTTKIDYRKGEQYHRQQGKGDNSQAYQKTTIPEKLFKNPHDTNYLW